MKKCALQLVRSVPLPRQIADHLRTQIRDGIWQAGDKLPTAREFAAQWETDQATVHRAMSQLAREGMIDRKPRAGSFVRQARPLLTTVGIYLRSTVMSPGASPFQQALVDALRAELSRAGLGVHFFVDPRSEAEQASPWTQLVDGVERHEIQGVILPVTDPTHTAWLTALSVPIACLSSGSRHTLGVDHRQLMRLTVQALVGQGCRRVGLIASTAVPRLDMARLFIDEATDAGLEVRDGWIEVPPLPPHAPSDATHHHRFGYESMRRIWALGERPEGLAVYPDSMASGVILAALEANIAVPEQLRLVLHRNRGVPLLCPMPATFVELDTAEAAAILVRQLRDLHAGKPVERIYLTHRLIERETS